MGRGDAFLGAAGRGGDFSSRRSGDRLDLGRPFSGSVYPRRGRGYGVQGEAAYPDLLDHWDKLAGWQSWRKGLGLAVSQLVGGAERWSAVEALGRSSFETATLRYSPVLLAGFTSKESPEGRWTVAVKPRGTEISRAPVGVQQREFWVYLPPETGLPPLRLIEVRGNGIGGMEFSQSLIGEVVEDSAVDESTLANDLADGIGLLCVGVFNNPNVAYFDATKAWRREYTDEGRLITRMEAIPFDQPPPFFRTERHLTQSLTLSCNCPSYSGIEYAKLAEGELVGGQNLFPMLAPSGLMMPGTNQEENAEGVRRCFSTMPWDRLPGRECKHCHAARWAIGSPMEEPSDMLSLDSSYWSDLSQMAQIEDMAAPLATDWFLAKLRSNLLNEQALSDLDVTLLGSSVATVVGVMPQRVSLLPFQLGPVVSNQGGVGFAELQVPGSNAGSFSQGIDNVVGIEPPPEDGSIGVVLNRETVSLVQRRGLLLRKNESHCTSDWVAASDAAAGDWWLGRGSAAAALVFDGPSSLVEAPAIIAVAASSELPRVIP